MTYDPMLDPKHWRAEAAAYRKSTTAENKAHAAECDRIATLLEAVPVPPDPTPVPPTPAPGVYPGSAKYLGPIPASPRLDLNSAAKVNAIAGGAFDQYQILGSAFSLPIYIAMANDPPRPVRVRQEPAWGKCNVSTGQWRIPPAAAANSGSDGKVCIIDPTNQIVIDLWRVQVDSTGAWSCDWGGVYPIAGDGRGEPSDYFASVRNDQDVLVDRVPAPVFGATPTLKNTGSGLSTYAGCILNREVAAGAIPHALVFATTLRQGPTRSQNYRYPATATDAFASDGTGPERLALGTRVQLDPTADISSLPPAVKMIAAALQTYGAYVVDGGGIRVGFGRELVKPGESDPWLARFGVAGSQVIFLNQIPWAKLRVLARWDGV